MKPWRRPERFDLTDAERNVVPRRGNELLSINPDELFSLLALRARADELSLDEHPDDDAVEMCSARSERTRQTAIELVRRLGLPKR